MKKALVLIVLLALVAAGGYFYFTHNSGKQEVSAGMLSAKLENASDCTTQKLIYNGYVESTSGKIPILTKKSFLMMYKSTVRAGFDVSKTDIEIEDKSVIVTLPEMEVQEITIDPRSLEFRDTSLTIIKPDGQEETKKALIAAENDVKSKIGESGLLEAAAENADSLIKGLFEDSIGDRELVIKHAE